MKAFNILSPSGRIHRVNADNIYHAISLVSGGIDNFKYEHSDYFKLNKH